MAMNKQTLSDIADFKGKRVLVRVDFNVPFTKQGEISDDTRIVETLPTLNYLLERGAKVVVASHLGRPKGVVVESLRLNKVFEALQKLLPNVSVSKSEQVVGAAVEAQVQALAAGSLLLLENVRFEAGEEKNDPALAQQFANLADIYVNDAFGAAHRAHASTEGVARLVPHAVAGLLMARELEALGGILSQPKRPFTAIIGGSKISSKISVLTHLLDKVNNLIVGGGMAYTFLLAQGYKVGNSIVEPDFVETAKTIINEAKAKGVRLILSEDLVVADAFSEKANTQLVPISAIPEGWEGVDVGPKTREAMSKIIAESQSILWNGPVGVFEMAPFQAGTRAIAQAVVEATQRGAQSILGGGDTVAAVELFGLDKASFTHVSTGGGASLEFLEGRELPGLAALQDKREALV
jgi:phosphoglycerate kinase